MKAERYPAYKDSDVPWLGEVPTHWEVKRLKFVAESINQKTDNFPEGATYYAMENIESWTAKLLPSEIELSPESQTNNFQKGDVLFGKLRPYLAKVLLTETDGFCSTELLVLRGHQQLPAFIKYCTLSKGFIETVDGSTFGSKMPRANWDFIGNMLSVIPPLPEQTAIAAFLDHETARLDTLIGKKQRLIDLLREERAALISQAVTRGLDPTALLKESGIDWLGRIPAHWEVKRLKHLGRALLGLTYDPSEVVNEGEGTLVLRSSNVQDRKIVFDDNVYVQKDIPEKIITIVGDILICSRNGSRALIGKNAMIDVSSAGLTFGAFMTIFRSAANRYLFWVFNSHLFECQSGSFLTSTINQLLINNLYSFEVPLPPLAEQQALILHLDYETARIDTLRAKVETAIERLKEYRAALIAAAVTGKIDVRSAMHEGMTP